MGTVYSATDTSLKRNVAIKSLHKHLTKDQVLLDRFRNEAKAMGGLSHPGVVSVYDFIEQDGEYYIIMEKVIGQDLETILQQSPNGLPMERALHLVLKILSVLDYAHRNGIIHRDIKPSNILVLNDDNIKVIDFGIARLIGEGKLTATGSAFGSAHYMSPEQIIKPHSVDHRTDVYSVGIVLYEMLTGQLPFKGSSDFEIKRAQLEKELTPPTVYNPDIPEWLDKAVIKALQKNRDQRYSGCGEFAEIIELGLKNKLHPEEIEIKASEPSLENTTLEPERITDEEYAAYIGKNSSEYLKQFTKFSKQDIDAFAWTWHWPSFFFLVPWMFSRKMYKWVAIVLVGLVILSSVCGLAAYEFPNYFMYLMIKILWLPVLLAQGGIGYFLYYKHCKAKITKIKQRHFSLKQRHSSLNIYDLRRELTWGGGRTNYLIAIPIMIIFLCIIALPQFAFYIGVADSMEADARKVRKMVETAYNANSQMSFPIKVKGGTFNIGGETSTFRAGNELTLLRYNWRGKLSGYLGYNDRDEDFHSYEFVGKQTVDLLCDSLKKDGFAIAENTTAELNKLLDQSDLYYKLAKKMKTGFDKRKFETLQESYQMKVTIAKKLVAERRDARWLDEHARWMNDDTNRMFTKWRAENPKWMAENAKRIAENPKFEADMIVKQYTRNYNRSAIELCYPKETPTSGSHLGEFFSNSHYDQVIIRNPLARTGSSYYYYGPIAKGFVCSPNEQLAEMYLPMWVMNIREAASSTSEVIMEKNEFGGKTLEKTYNGQSDKAKEIIYFNDHNVVVKSEDFFTDYIIARSGVAKVIYQMNKYGRKANAEVFYADSFSATNGINRAVIALDYSKYADHIDQNNVIKQEYYANDKLIIKSTSDCEWW